MQVACALTQVQISALAAIMDSVKASEDELGRFHCAVSHPTGCDESFAYAGGSGLGEPSLRNLRIQACNDDVVGRWVDLPFKGFALGCELDDGAMCRLGSHSERCCQK